MANIKITGYAELAAPISTDLLEVVSDPGGTPISKKVQIRNLFKGGGQIAFPATAVPSADPNTLDDWEVGTWTPILSRSSVASAHTYTDQYGYYTKIGNIVTCRFRIKISATGTAGSGVNIVTGLPFAVGGAAYSQSGGCGFNFIFSVTGARSCYGSGTQLKFLGIGPTQTDINENYVDELAYLAGNIVYQI